MTSTADQDAQKSGAKIFGLLYFPAFVVLIIANFGILHPLIGDATPAKVAQNVLAHATLFRLGASIFLLYGMSVLVMAAALYVVLRRTGQTLALIALLSRSVYGLVWILVALNLFSALRLLSQPVYADVPPASLQGIARLYLSGFDQYYVGLLFWSSGAAVGAYLWLKSRYISRALAIFGILASAWATGCTLVLFVLPNFQDVVNLWLFDSPMVLFEIILSVLLVFRGLSARNEGATQ